MLTDIVKEILEIILYIILQMDAKTMEKRGEWFAFLNQMIC